MEGGKTGAMTYTPIIGFEVHVELKTKSKMFCACDNNWFAQAPNTHTCPVCLGLPGALPVPNKQAIEWCMKIGMALHCTIPLFSKFDRKNYFYPDLAKGYQISQYDLPFAKNGYMRLENGQKIGIRRVHMEEDTGKLLHETIAGERVSLIDFNRSGVPLVEIVTEPDFRTAGDVKEYLQKLQQIVRYLEVSDADMEKGQMRLEPNISLLSQNKTGLPDYKVEVKNINSFSFVEKAISYELQRQKELLEKGQRPKQETRGWDENKNRTVSQRSKEEAMDYRYFPEPDIPPFRFNKAYIVSLKSSLPELPQEKKERFVKNFKLRDADASLLVKEKLVADYFEEAVALGKPRDIRPKQIANVIINRKINTEEILPAALIKNIITDSTIEEISTKELDTILAHVLMQNPKAVEDFKKGKETVIMYLIGQSMRLLKGRAQADKVKKKLLRLLQS